MNIYSMTATFGKLEHQTLTLQPGLNVIEAPNEWGKSTWCAFLVAMLYGIETRVHSTKTALADKERYAPWSGAPMSGRMEICWDGRDITIERSSKGRGIFNILRAYETQTGLDVPEITADNCGQVLLGVEKSVFTRAGFLKLTDLPVTEDKALWRRLNALVTTGDESGAADTLAQTLKDLKNRCRANRANGLIPQAQAQQQALQGKLDQLQALRIQDEKLRRRQQDLQQQIAQLKNHKAALSYAAAQSQAEKSAAARYHLEQARLQVQRQEDACRALPEAESIYQSLQQLQQLRQRREALQMEAQMHPGAPMPPEVPAPFRGCTPEQAMAQAEDDYAAFAQNAQVKKPSFPVLLTAGFCLTGIGLVLLAFLPVLAAAAVMAAGVVLAGIGLICHNKQKSAYAAAQNAAQQLLLKYRPTAPESWVSAARDYRQHREDHEAALAQHSKTLAHIKEDMAQINRQLDALTGGQPYLQWEQTQQDALQQHRLLSDALRQLRQAEAVCGALSHRDAMPAPPEAPDSLTWTEDETRSLLAGAEAEYRQLQLQLGRCHGQMEALGREDALNNELSAVNRRLEELNKTFAALELAQQTAIQASAMLQRRFAPKLSRRAQELFGKLTDQRYDRLSLGEDLSVTVGARQEDTLRSDLWRSDGTVDQLYLALRLAVAEELTPAAPLILDDALVRFDDKRLEAAMEILKEQAQSKQVILFTCQGRETKYL